MTVRCPERRRASGLARHGPGGVAHWVLLALVASLALGAPSARAQAPAGEPAGSGDEDYPLPYTAPDHPTVGGFEVSGTIELGWRFTNLDGSLNAYRAIVDLPRGPSAGFSRIELRRPDDDGRIFDSLLVEGSGGGGEPVSSGRIRAAKRGIYVAEYVFSDVDTFNFQPDFANPLFDAGVVLAPHGWDRTRRSDAVDVRLFPQRRVEGHVAYRRTHESGLGLGTDLSDASLVFARALDNTVHDVRAGVALRWPTWYLSVEQGLRRYHDDERDVADPFTVTDPDTLARFERLRSARTSAPATRVIATANPWSALKLTARMAYVDFDTAGQLLETADSAGSDVSRSESNGVDAGHAFVFDATQDVRVLDRVRLTNAVRYRRSRTVGTSAGTLVFGGDLVNLARDTASRSYRDARIEDQAGIEIDVAKDAVVRAGYRFARRRFAYDRTDRSVFSAELMTARTVLHDDEERYDAFLAGGSYRLRRDARVFVEYENGREPNPNFGFDDERVFFDRAGDFQLLRIRGAWTPAPWLELAGSVRTTDRSLRSGVIAGRDVVFDDPDNPVFTRLADGEPPVQRVRSRAASASVRVVPWERLQAGVTFDRIANTASVSYLTARERTDGQGNIVYDTVGRFFRYRDDEALLTADLNAEPFDRVSIVALYSLVSAAGDVPLHYHQASARGVVRIGRGVSGFVEWRLYDYDDHRVDGAAGTDGRGITDFRANHATVGVRWEF